MRTGPCVECKGCGLPILLGSAVCEGAKRVLACPLCDHVHLWIVVDGEARTSLGSSVE